MYNANFDYVLYLSLTDKAPLEEVCNLWEELNLMKQMKPHENIVNLLGYCTTESKCVSSCIIHVVHDNYRVHLMRYLCYSLVPAS